MSNSVRFDHVTIKTVYDSLSQKHNQTSPTRAQFEDAVKEFKTTFGIKSIRKLFNGQTTLSYNKRELVKGVLFSIPTVRNYLLREFNGAYIDTNNNIQLNNCIVSKKEIWIYNLFKTEYRSIKADAKPTEIQSLFDNSFIHHGTYPSAIRSELKRINNQLKPTLTVHNIFINTNLVIFTWVKINNTLVLDPQGPPLFSKICSLAYDSVISSTTKFCISAIADSPPGDAPHNFLAVTIYDPQFTKPVLLFCNSWTLSDHSFFNKYKTLLRNDFEVIDCSHEIQSETFEDDTNCSLYTLEHLIRWIKIISHEHTVTYLLQKLKPSTSDNEKRTIHETVRQIALRQLLSIPKYYTHTWKKTLLPNEIVNSLYKTRWRISREELKGSLDPYQDALFNFIKP